MSKTTEFGLDALTDIHVGELERALLGQVLTYPSEMIEVGAELRRIVFSDDLARLAVEQIELAIEDDIWPDDRIVAAALGDRGHIVDRLKAYANGSDGRAKDYWQTLKDVYLDRMGLAELDNIKKARQKEGKPSVQWLRNQLTGLLEMIDEVDTSGQSVTLNQATDNLIAREEQIESGVTLGIVELKFWWALHEVAGRCKWLITVLAESGTGKSSFLAMLAYMIALTLRRPVIIFTMEEDHRDYALRFLKIISGDIGDIEYSSDVEVLRQLAHALKEHDLPILINDQTHMSPLLMAAEIRKAKARYGNDLVVVADYFTLMSGDGKQSENEAAKWGQIAKALGKMCKRLNVPMFLASQVNSDGKTRWTKELWNACWQEWFLDRMEKDDPDNTYGVNAMRLHIRKNKLGQKTKDDKPIPFKWIPELVRVEPLVLVGNLQVNAHMDEPIDMDNL
jgi:replicative DNA helicase